MIFADLFMGNSALTYSEKGYGYAMEKAGSTRGWTFTMFEEAFNQGYPQELKHFIDCVREDRPPVVTGEDGRAVLELMYAAYHSARIGQKVPLPFASGQNRQARRSVARDLSPLDEPASIRLRRHVGGGVATFWRDRCGPTRGSRSACPAVWRPTSI